MRFNRTFTFTFLILTFVIQEATAQQFNFSQYSFTDQRINPALVGIGNYWKFGGIHREQKTGPDFDILSTSISASYPFVKANNAGTFGGLGITLLDDKAGSSKAFKVQEVGLSYAMQVRTGINQQLALGASIFRQTRGFDFDHLITNFQYIPDRGFDTSLDNGENFEELNRSFTRIGVGAHWENRDVNDQRSGHFGISVFDLNQPVEAFIDSTTKMDPTYYLSAGFRAFSVGQLSFYPEALISHVNGQTSYYLGANARYGLQNGGYLVLQGQYLTGGEVVAGIQFAKKDFRIGVSYDISLNNANSGNQGAFEFGFEFTGLVKSKSKPEKLKRTTPAPQPKPPVEEVQQDTVQTPTEPPVIPNEENDEEQEPKEEVKTETGAQDLEFEPIIVERITKRLGFEFNKANLNDSMKANLDGLSKKLKDDPQLRVTVYGHTDSIGDEDVNARLSDARANAVRGYLISSGISANRIKAEGKGELEPVSSNSTAKGRALNRRVELIIHR